MRPIHAFSAPILALLLSLASAGQATGQCILANPSFELGGSGGAVFGGWNQFGVVGSVTEVVHGAKAARVSGPNNGDWGVSGFWQSQDSQPGEQWEATGHVAHPADEPLTGASVALVNIEWRDGAGGLIDYDSFTVADAATPVDEYLEFSVVSDPAPAGTVTTRLLLAVLQSPDDASPEVYYDQITFYSTTPPTIDDIQWNDFPGGRTVSFGSYTWRVKGPGVYGPGINYFCDAPECVWVDAQENLHLTLADREGTWACTEVTLEEDLGYGDYIVTTVGRLDRIDPNVVLGIFLWEYGTCWDYGYLWWNPYNEIDIEYSRWGDPAAEAGQFVAQPYDYPGNLERFDATFSEGEITSHAMLWLADRVEYRVWRGGPDAESPASTIHAWSYTGPHIPRPEQPRMHLNLWKLEDTPAADQEVVFDDFTFVPASAIVPVGADLENRIPTATAGHLYPASPNPFNPQTTIRFDLTKDGIVALEVYDLDGRRLKTLASGYHTAGEYGLIWDGRDEEGRRSASGVYLVCLRGNDFVESRRVALIK